MSDYQPKVGDKVMVGEHGPYEVVALSDRHDAVMLDCGDKAEPGPRSCWTRPEWLTPAPEPEPDEPTTPGALVRDDYDRLWVRDNDTWRPWNCMTDMSAGPKEWHGLNRPCVILTDPAEVEALREERDQWESDYQEAMRQVDGLRERVAEERSLGAAEKRRADELQQAIEEAVKLVDDPGFWSTYSVTRPKMRDILRGES